MWKCLVLLVFVQRVILSQPVSHENIREARHLNFEECCPCPTSGRSNIREQVSWDSPVPRDCPCQQAIDSDTASSIIRPAMRAMEPFIRPVGTTKEPKPLLTPEVGLASSVLETLREVTDQEYKEALARDAARSVIGASESNSIEKNSPTNIVNIILKPKHGHTDDVIPEASNIQEARFIEQPMGKNSGFHENGAHLFRNTLLPLSKIPSNSLFHKKLFDMDNSASNIQEQILQPLRSNLLDDLKLKSELLKMKLFPGIGNNLEARSNLNTETTKISKLRLPSLLDNIKIPKENSLLAIPSSTNIMDRYTENDVIPSRNTLEKSSSLINDFPSSVSGISNKFDTKRKKLNMKPNNMSNQLESSLPYKANERSDIDITELIDKSDCNLNNGIENNDFTNDNQVQLLDAASSPSEISEVEPIANDISQIDKNEKCDIVDEENIDGDTNNLGDNSQHTIIEEMVPSGFNKQLYEENPDAEQINSIYSETKPDKIEEPDETLCNVKDIDGSASDNIPQTTNIKENENTNIQLDNVNEVRETDNLNFYEQRSSNENMTTMINKNVKVDDNRNVNALPNIKENILKTLENFKKTNDKIQEKLKANVQDALQSFVVKKNPVVEIESPSSTIDSNIEDTKNPTNSIQTTDLQEMSNRILNLSNMRESQANNLKYENDNKQLNKNNMRTSELDNTSEPENLKLENSGEIQRENNYRELKEIDPKILDDPCMKSSKNSNLIDSDTDLDRTEMISQASSPAISSTHHVVQPKNLNVKNVLDNFKTSVTDLFNNQRESKFRNSISDNENDNTIINGIYENNAQTSDNYLARKNENQRLDHRPKVKNSDSNLNLYKAKIAVPTSLNRDAYRKNPERTSFNNLRHPMDTISPISRKSITDNDKRNDAFNSKAQIFSTLRNAPLSTDGYRPKNIQDTFELPLTKQIFRNHNNILGKASPREILGTIARTNKDLNEKFRAFHSDLNDKLSSVSQKVSNIKPLQLRSEPRYKNTKTSSNLKRTKLPSIKGNPSMLTTTKKSSKLNIPPSSNKLIDISKPKLVQKIKSPAQLTLDSKNSPTILRPSKLKNDITKRKGLKLKPLKDNQVTITFTTTVRPILTLKRKNELKSRSSKVPNIKSQLKSGEPKTSASERIASQVTLLGRKSHNEQQMPNNDENTSIYELRDNSRSNSEEIYGKKTTNPLLSKIREVVKARANGEASRKIDSNTLKSESDEVLSASNLNAVALKDRPLKENVSYKCKMMCFEDHDAD